MITAFPKIMAFGHKTVKDILDGPVEVTEKLDGSQLVFGNIGGVLQVRSKGKQLDLANPDQMFTDGVEYVLRIKERLDEGDIYYCEYLRKPKHNTLKYNSIPKHHLMLFGVSTVDGDFVGNYGDLCYRANHLDIDVAPLVFYGDIGEGVLDTLRVMLDRDSYLGGAKIEGVVIKNYAKPYLLADRYLPIMSAKFVSEEFKEVHRVNWSRDNTNKGGLEHLKDMYRTEARWAKAVHSLRDIGSLLQEPADIGPLIKVVHNDIIEECKDDIKDALYSLFKKEILGHATKGFAEWYKLRLISDTYD